MHEKIRCYGYNTFRKPVTSAPTVSEEVLESLPTVVLTASDWYGVIGTLERYTYKKR